MKKALILISLLFFTISCTNNKEADNNTSSNTETEKLTITVIDDKRCMDCWTEDIISQLKLIPDLQGISFEIKDFSESWTSEMLQKNEILVLPAIIFSNNKVEKWLSDFLNKTKDWRYLLNIWAKFNPFIERSDRWFLLLDKEELEKIKTNSYIKWNSEAEITWLEYSDLECPYCAKLHRSDVEKALSEKYSDKLNIIFNHFPLDFHKNAQIASEILECTWEEKWADTFYALLKSSFDNAEEKEVSQWWQTFITYDTSKSSSKKTMIDIAISLWVNENSLDKCLDDEKYSNKVVFQADRWAKLFWITWTPWNVLINNTTWEYEIIWGAYPKEAFINIIDRLIIK